jgi:hypothetical protein
MARPIEEGMDYFQHDTDASSDEKVEALRAVYGNDGYAFYFIMLERIYRTPNSELDISGAETIQILSRKVGVTPQIFMAMLDTAFKYNCFDRTEYENKKVLTSNGIKKRASKIQAKRVAERDRYHRSKRIISAAETTPEIIPETIQETPPETPQVKYSKVSILRIGDTPPKITSPVTEIRNYFADKYKEHLGLDYPHEFAKDGKILKNLLKSCNDDTEFVKAFIDWFFQCNDDYLREKGYNIPLLKTKLTQYHVSLKKDGRPAGKKWEGALIDDNTS